MILSEERQSLDDEESSDANGAVEEDKPAKRRGRLSLHVMNLWSGFEKCKRRLQPIVFLIILLLHFRIQSKDDDVQKSSFLESFFAIKDFVPQPSDVAGATALHFKRVVHSWLLYN